MSTVEKTPQLRNVADAQRRVRDPLQKLRGYIRTYVSLEAAAIALLYIAVCFWISFALDYGAFKIPFLAFDWVQEVPWLLRVLLLGVFVFFLGAIVATKAVTRLIQRFRDSTLAIELERRFPKILGDRLITAIELSNRSKVIEQGYSAAMVDETVVEAAERVEKLPLKDVFRWGRLKMMAFIVFLATVVMYLLTAAGFCSVESLVQQHATLAGFGEFHEAVAIWFERNVLLQNTIWPRRSYLVFLEPDDANLRIGRDVLAPGMRVRALEYVVADSSTAEGWRALTWNDLQNKKNLIGGQPAVPPVGWKVRDKEAGLTVDEVAMFFAKFDIRKGVPDQPLPFTWAIADDSGWRALAWTDLTPEYLNGMAAPKLPATWHPSIDEVVKEMSSEANQADPDLADVRNVLAHLDRLTAMRQTLDKVNERITGKNMRRTMRKLIVPAAVSVTVKGLSANNTISLTPLPNNEFTGSFGEMKEKTPGQWNFTYFARGEDYNTASRAITILPPPTMLKLYREEERPAYLYYRAGGGSNVTDDHIKGKKQPIERAEVSLTGAELITIDCPAGTDLTLFAEADKELSGVKLFQGENGPEIPADVKLSGNKFEMTFKDLRQELTFDLRLSDRDNIKGKRKIKLRPTRDTEPSIDLSIAEWVRKTKDGYMVSPKARIPLSGNIKDDNGLSRVRYAYTVAQVESTAVVDIKALYASGSFGIPRAPAGGLNTAIFLAGALYEYEKAKNIPIPENKDAKYYPAVGGSVPRFEGALRDQRGRQQEFVPLPQVTRLLAERQAAGFRTLLKDFKFEPDLLTQDLTPNRVLTDFPLDMAEETLAAREGKTQVRYRVTLWVEATDNDLDGPDGPKTGTSKERYQLFVVSGDDIVIEIGKDEEKLGNDVNGVFEKLLDVQSKLNTLLLDLGGGDALKPEALSAMAVRAELLEQTLEGAQRTTKEVLMKYRTLFMELKGNRIEGKKINTVLKEIIKPLEDIDGEFEDAREKLQKLRKELDSKESSLQDAVAKSKQSGNEAKTQVQKLINIIRDVMDKMSEQIQLQKEIERLRKQEQALEMQYNFIKQHHLELEKKALGGG